VEVVVGFLAFGVTVAIAAVFVVREAARIGRNPPAAVFDADDAFEWVVEHLPDDVAATLTADDVRRILDFQVEFLAGKGVSSNGHGAANDDAVIVGSPAQVAYIVERAAATGEAYLPEQVQGVMDTQLAYFRWIGAVGPRAERSDPGNAEGSSPG
jgi:hypothetical protein